MRWRLLGFDLRFLDSWPGRPNNIPPEYEGGLRDLTKGILPFGIIKGMIGGSQGSQSRLSFVWSRCSCADNKENFESDELPRGRNH